MLWRTFRFNVGNIGNIGGKTQAIRRKNVECSVFVPVYRVQVPSCNKAVHPQMPPNRTFFVFFFSEFKMHRKESVVDLAEDALSRSFQVMNCDTTGSQFFKVPRPFSPLKWSVLCLLIIAPFFDCPLCGGVCGKHAHKFRGM